MLVDNFSGAAGELTISYDNEADVTQFKVDVDGDGNGDMVILVTGDARDFTSFVL